MSGHNFFTLFDSINDALYLIGAYSEVFLIFFPYPVCKLSVQNTENPSEYYKTSRLLDYYYVSFVMIVAVMEVVSSKVAMPQCWKSKIKRLNQYQH